MSFSLRQTHRAGLRSLASHGCQEKAVSSGPTAKVCFQLPDIPTDFLWPGRLANHPPVSHPPSLPADPNCGRSCAEPWGRTSHSSLTQLHESYGSSGGHVAWFGPRRCTGKSARWLPGKTFLQHKKKGLLKERTLCPSPSLSAWGTIP